MSAFQVVQLHTTVYIQYTFYFFPFSPTTSFHCDNTPSISRAVDFTCSLTSEDIQCIQCELIKDSPARVVAMTVPRSSCCGFHDLSSADLPQCTIYCSYNTSLAPIN